MFFDSHELEHTPEHWFDIDGNASPEQIEVLEELRGVMLMNPQLVNDGLEIYFGQFIGKDPDARKKIYDFATRDDGGQYIMKQWGKVLDNNFDLDLISFGDDKELLIAEHDSYKMANLLEPADMRLNVQDGYKQQARRVRLRVGLGFNTTDDVTDFPVLPARAE